MSLVNGKAGPANGSPRGVAADQLRRHNLATVLEHLHLGGAATRSQLTAFSGLNRSTIADLIGELSDLGLVAEARGTTRSGPGRPSPVAQVVPEGAVVLAVEVSVDSMAVATVGLGGHVFNQIRIARSRGQFHPQTTVNDIAEMARPLLSALPAQYNLVGMGAAIVGIVRRHDGLVHLAPNLGWRELPLGEMLADTLDLNVPVHVANDADLGALGEHRRGGLGQVSHIVYIGAEVGIGCGLIIDGVPLLGSAGYAGEVGHMFVNPDGHECRCGATGCWETEAGEKALLGRVESLSAVSGLEAVDAVVKLAAGGDADTLQAISDTGHWLGVGISNIVNLFNPEVIVLGGLYHRLFEYLEHSVNEGASRALHASRKMVQIKESVVGQNATLVGASELALAELIDDPANAAN
ncbi:MAG: ROK family protein [bacterium]|nr:ROK family protein [bacterium]